MKIRINLQPYREARRKETRRRFWLTLGAVAAAGVFSVIVGHGVIATAIATQGDRNAYISQQNAALDEKIAEIKSLRESIDMVKNQQEIIAKLQGDRAAPGQLLDQMVRQVPDGIYLTSLKQSGASIVVSGNAQSADLVAAFIANLMKSPYLEKPELIEIKAVTEKSRRYQSFSLQFAVKPPANDEDAKKAEASAAAAAVASAASAASAASVGSTVEAASAPASAASGQAVTLASSGASAPQNPALSASAAASR